MLSRDLRKNVVMIGQVKKYAGLGSVTDLTGKSTFLTDAYLLRYSGLFDVAVGVDTGMMQIAGSITSDAQGGYERVSGNRTVSLFGPTEPAIYRPYDPTGSNQTGPFNIVVKPKVKSSTMGVGGWAGDLIQRPYMREIDSREIVEKVEQHLAAKRAT